MFGNWDESSPLKSVMGTTVSGSEGSWERTFQVTKASPMELSFLGTKVLWYESSSYLNHFRQQGELGYSSILNAYMKCRPKAV